MNDPADEASDLPDHRVLLGHDLRAAAADVVGGLRLLEQEVLTSAARAQLERVQAASDLMVRLMDELLDDTASLPGDTSVVDLRRLLDRTMRHWRGAAAPLGVTVDLDIDDGVTRLWRVEALPLRRILANVLGNALRHARSRVTLTLEQRNGGAALLIIDDGPGFPPELPLLFEPAQTGPGSHGTGMGLHIATEHAGRIGATITARNVAEGGAEVSLHLPAELQVADPPPSEEIPDLSGWKVLIVDDSATVQTLLAGMLSRMGAECDIATDGVAALNWLARARFDLALIDVEMPLLGGREVIRAERLRQARGVAPPMPMIAMTAHRDPAIQADIVEEGADGILTKPLPDLETFGRAISGLLADAPRAADWQPEAAPVLSAAILADLLASAGPSAAPEMLERMKEDLANVEKTLENALAQGDLAEARFQTHILLSLTGALGALPTQTLAQKLSELLNTGDTDAVRIVGRACLGRLGELRAELASATG
ncbi:hybrid sensor histidine kinase/response regulator [Jannaschia aquimarina]|uniref:ArcB protein n=1 Tax=Jannaschia aquimarina TaxID=935700 RepID=A0A0D1EGG0_9RHOB|nr:response regulator [Jannaschia aquimarina]KIT16011.1 Aerobic respiration control sensor protein ArcB [Jannaschia aquimarina]SNT00028.1 Histidine kinase-, DNA gyrase B-, and HSP90-like ATPase [Jannaschia aquimarina]